MMAGIMKMKPIRQTIGATFMRLTLKMLGSKAVSVELGPAIRAKPMRMIATPMAMRM